MKRPEVKVYLDDYVEMRLFARTDSEGCIRLSHAIINGVRYYPEDFKLDTLICVEKLLVYQKCFGFENVTP